MKSFYYISILFLFIIAKLFASDNELDCNLLLNTTQNKHYFIENKGQWNNEVRYLYKTKNYNVWITDFGIVYDYFNECNVIKMVFNGRNDKISFNATGKSKTYYNYFIGNDKNKWATNVRIYNEVKVRNIYDGIDIRYYIDTANGNNLRYDFELKPFANPDDIGFILEGTENICFNDNELEFLVNEKSYKHTNLFAFQNIDDKIKKIECSFDLDENKIGFDVGEYDRTNKLTIDPLIYSLVVGGTLEERAFAVVTDSLGCIYFTGFTYSPEYPTIAGSYKINKIDTTINTDVFVSKVNASGNGLIFSTYIGGSGSEVSKYIKIDKNNNVYISGESNSNSNIVFPVVAPSNATTELTMHKNGYNVFLTKLSTSGDTLDFSILLGANNNDNASGFDFILDTEAEVFQIAIAVQLSNTPVSLIYPYISSNAVQSTHNGGQTDCYIAVINNVANQINYASFVGGSGSDVPKDLVVDKDNNILLTGNTTSTDFPTSDSAYHKTNSGAGDIFVSKLNTSLTSILYSTYIGGTNYDNVEEIDVDNVGNFYITGHTLSNNFPASPLNQRLKSDSANIFILNMSSDSGKIIYSTSITSNKENFATGIVVDDNKYAHISGYTTSSDYPITWDAFIDEYSAHGDALYSVLDSTGDSLIFSSYIGGDQYEYAYGLALDNMTSAYICGATTSEERFPHSKIFSDSVWVGFDTITMTNIYEKTLGSYECFIFKSTYKPYPGELATNIDMLGNIYCPNNELQIVVFTPYGFYYPDNEFRIQLSDVNGNFSPTSMVIGILQAAQGGAMKITFPSNLPSSKHYRIRAISTHPRSIGYSNNIDLDISHSYIELDTNDFPKSVCSGAILTANVGSNICFNTDNVYTLELSDINGNFSTPIILGTKTGIGSFTLYTTIADTLIPSNKYKIRVVSSAPKIVSNEINFEISKPQITLDDNENLKLQNACAGNSFNFGFNATKCFNSDNIFYLILSDTSGNFNVCDTIGIYIGNGADTMLTMNITIPSNLPFSEKYKIKLASTSPELEYFLGETSYNYTIGSPHIYIDNLTELVLCRNISLELDLHTNNCFAVDNIFQIYIKSDVGLIKIGETLPNSKEISLVVNNNGNIQKNTSIIVRSTNPVIQTIEISITLNEAEIEIIGHSPIELCAGMDFDLNYRTNGCVVDTMNAFVEMANDSNFLNKIVIGMEKVFNDSGKISCKLPDSIDFYKKYYVRVVDSFGFKSSIYLLSINHASAEITTEMSELEMLCLGVNFYIDFEIEGCFDIDNIFRIILSDAGGEFNSNAKIVGELKDNKSGRIYISIPLDIDTSGYYKIKITSTHPEIENILDLEITFKKPYILIDSFDNLSHCNPNPTMPKDKISNYNSDGINAVSTDNSYISFITSDCFGEDNYFILQFGLNGNFTDPINVDTCDWNEREFNFMLPENMGTDTFRFRVISTNPMIVSNENGFDVTYNQPYVALIGSNKPTVCRNKQFKFNYQSSDCFDSTNIFYLEMSDENGNFNNPIVLDFNSTLGNGTFNVLISENIPYGKVYKLRIRSTVPEGYFIQNQIVFSISGPEILTGNLYRTRTARNDTLYVPFNCNCMEMEGKVFVAQLSDPYGNFDNVLEIGSRIGWEPNGKIYTRISLFASDGNHYRIRVVSKNPDIAGTTNGKDITIFGLIYLNIGDDNGIKPSINPMPFDKELVVNTNGAYIKSLSIVDILGKTRIQLDCSSLSSQNNSLAINTIELPSGVYTLLIDTGIKIIRKVVLKIE
jgi:hypothetical protein